MATNTIADDKTRISLQIPIEWKPILEEIVKREGFRSVAELFRDAVERTYFRNDAKISEAEKTVLRRAIKAGESAALRYLDQSLEILQAAEDPADYGKEIAITAKKTSKKPPKKQP